MEKAKLLPILKKALSIALYVIFSLLLVLTAWLAIDKLVLKNPVPSVFGISLLTVETGSMNGTIDEGDLIVIHDTGDYKTGDIITFLYEGERIPTTHRIILYAGSDDKFITKGDANNARDPEPVTEDIIFGEVILVVPKVGVFADWVRKEGWLYLVSVFAIICLGYFILKGEGAKKNADGEQEEEAAQSENSEDAVDSAEVQAEVTEAQAEETAEQASENPTEQ